MRIPHLHSRRRRGMVLIMVLSILTLFSIIGVSFVLVSDSLAESARIAREAEVGNRPDMDPELAFSIFLGQLNYDVPDDARGVWSAMRGHSLGRDMYGWRDDPNALNAWAFSGTGRLRNVYDPMTYPEFAGRPNHELVNYTYFVGEHLRDPERNRPRTGLTDPNGRGEYIGEGNPPYTYPDHNHMFLAATQASDGRVLVPSFHRPWLFGPLFDPANPTNPQNNANWTNTEGKYLTLRPRPQENPGFPFPEDATGDVKNWPWAPGGNDSIWMDLGAPVMTSPDGRKFKALFAPLIVDLDNRLNLNVHGNIRGDISDPAISPHLSNQGWGAWAVNLDRVLTRSEWKNLFLGNPATGTQRTLGRYGTDRLPANAGGPAPGGTSPRAWARVDFDGANETGSPRTATVGALLPGEGGTRPFRLFPTFPNGFGDGSNAENLDHPLRYRFVPDPTVDDRRIPLSHLAALLRHEDTGGSSLSSDLVRLLPNSFGSSANAARNRRLVTTHSFDVDVPGVVPYVWDNRDATRSYTMDDPSQPPALLAPTGVWPRAAAPWPFPASSSRMTVPTNPTPPKANSDYDAATWRSNLGAISRLDLNRSLKDSTKPTGDPAEDYPDARTPGYADAATGLLDLTNPTVRQAYDGAERRRQQFAQEIFTRLRIATGVADPATVEATFGGVNSPQFRAVRWLAQLAVNIVDYVDEDRYNTIWRFHIDTTTDPAVPKPLYVIGTEMPRLLINEVYAQIDNDANDDFTDPAMAGVNRAELNYRLNVWVELVNAMVPEPAHTPFPETNDEPLEVKGTNMTPQPVYQLEIVTYDPAALPVGTNVAKSVLLNPANVTGESEIPGTKWKNRSVLTNLASQDPPPAIAHSEVEAGHKAGNNPFRGTPNAMPDMPGQNDGFYILAPDTDFTDPTNPLTPSSNDPEIPYTYKDPKMSLEIDLMDDAENYKPTILLRRLTHPHLPHNPLPGQLLLPGQPAHDPMKPLNPYITVDVARRIPENDSRFFTTAAGPNMNRDAVADRVSYGRHQPFAANNWIAQNPVRPMPLPMPVPPKHTFYRHNYEADMAPTAMDTSTTLKIPFDWLVHLDRQLVSPMELTHVSAYPPHLLTEYFVHTTPAVTTAAPPAMPIGSGTGPFPFAHRAQWFSELTRLYRFFELAETKPRETGIEIGGRIPGRININTIFDLEVFRALCDAQVGNSFHGNRAVPAPQGEDFFVDQIYNAMLDHRSRDYRAQARLTAQDRPFWGLGLGPAPGTDEILTHIPDLPNYTQSRGIKNTILSPQLPTDTNVWARRLFERDYAQSQADPYNKAVLLAQTQPHRRFEMLNKIFDRITTRSNVYAVWLTVGFFEVPDTNAENARPVRLGAEIGRNENRHIRHRMFAIVDRTQMQSFQTTTGQPITGPTNGDYSVTQTLTPAVPTTGSRPPHVGGTWTLQEGMVLTFVDTSGTVPNMETVVVRRNGMGALEADFRKTFPAGSTVIARGNPGPWARYDPRQDSCVRYFAIID